MTPASVEEVLTTPSVRWSAPDVVTLLRAPANYHGLLCSLGDQLARSRHGTRVSYVVNRNLNFSNVCTVGCRFCAFFRAPKHHEAFRLTVAEAVAMVQETPWVSEVCIQGGIDPALGLPYYVELLRNLKAWKPALHIHAFSPQEIVSLAGRSEMSISAVLRQLQQAGLDSIPGTAAEILDDGVRHKIAPLRLTSAEWKSVITSAAALSIPSSATLMFGHVESLAETAGHLLEIRRLQEKTGNFTEFVPMPFMPENTALKRSGAVTQRSTQAMYERLIAVSRLLLDDVIPNIQVSWVKAGMAGAAACLRAGANDLGGTLYGENITKSAGGEHGESKTPTDFEFTALTVGLTAVERNTLYEFARFSEVECFPKLKPVHD